MRLAGSNLSLSGADLERYRVVLSALLSPLRPGGTETWAGTVVRGFGDLVGSDRSFLMLPPAPSGGGVRIISPDLDASCREALEEFAPSDDGKRPGKDPEHERAMRRLAAAGVRVWNRERVERLTRLKFVDMDRFYAQLMEPYDVGDFATLTLWLPEGPAMISSLAPAPFDGEKLEVLSLLVPAFETAVATLRALENRGTAIGALLDRLDMAALVVFPDGGSHRNRRLLDLLDGLADPEDASRLVSELERMGGEALRAHERADEATPRLPLDAGTRAVEIAGGALRLHASWLPPGTAGPDPAALVLAEGVSARLPDPRALAGRYGLTPRQAQVARLLATGASNREIADRLEISPHTARHHAQSVLNRVGLHSRKALGLHFLEDRPAPP